MNLESEKTIVEKSAKDLFALLENVANFERLMPDNISKFQMLSEQSFVFALKGMPEISLEKKSSTPSNITEVSNNKSEVQLLFEGNFNPVMAMMVKTPISKFMETLVTKMKEL